MVQRGFFDVDERLAALSAAGDPLERLASVVDFELFRPVLICRNHDVHASRLPWPNRIDDYKVLLLGPPDGLEDVVGLGLEEMRRFDRAPNLVESNPLFLHAFPGVSGQFEGDCVGGHLPRVGSVCRSRTMTNPA